MQFEAHRIIRAQRNSEKTTRVNQSAYVVEKTHSFAEDSKWLGTNEHGREDMGVNAAPVGVRYKSAKNDPKIRRSASCVTD